MPETYAEFVNRVLRDHEGYTGDGKGGVGELPVGDRSTARKPIDKRDLREALRRIPDATAADVARAELAALRAEGAADQVSKGDAVILWTGQSNAVQPFDNSALPDIIDTRVQILNSARTAFVPLAAGQGGISGDATNHSLFNLTRLMMTHGGYDSVRVIMVAEGSRPISDWVGTSANRTVSSANTPKMWDIKAAVEAARTILGDPSLNLTHVFLIQGENDHARQMMPPETPTTYAADRLYFRQSLRALGFADTDTRWIDGELLRRDVASTSWRANQVITNLPRLGGEPSAVISTAGFDGQDEGLSVTVNGTPVPYTLHFSPAENSLYGIRAFEAVLALDGGKTVEPDAGWRDRVAPDGRIGFRPPALELTGGTTTLSSQWARGAVVNVHSGTNTVSLLPDDLRTGFAPSAGSNITFLVKPGTTLTVNTGSQNIVTLTGTIVNTITRNGGNGNMVLSLYWDGYNWRITSDVSSYQADSVGGPYWEIRNGRLYMRGQTAVGRAAGSTVAVTLPANAPAVLANQGVIIASSGCVATNITAAGFTLVRAVTIDTGATTHVTWEMADFPLA